MEVKIKQGNEMIDATIEMVDGVMVVSPKEVKFEPKDGDVVASPCGTEFFVFKCNQRDVYGECYFGFSFRKKKFFGAGIWNIVRLATEEEKQKLFDKIKEEGFEWDAEKKELVKLKWNLKYNDNYWSPALHDVEFMPWKYSWQNSKLGNNRLGKGWVFKTEEECQAFCDKLNDAINSI